MTYVHSNVIENENARPSPLFSMSSQCTEREKCKKKRRRKEDYSALLFIHH